MDLVFFPSELLYCPTQSAGASRCLTNVCGLKGKRKGRKRGRKEGEEKQGMEGGGRGGGRGEKEGERDGREGRKEGGRKAHADVCTLQPEIWSVCTTHPDHMALLWLNGTHFFLVF